MRAPHVSLNWEERSESSASDWSRGPFDHPPTTNYVALCLNLSSNILLKQVILLQKCGYFLWSVKQAFYHRKDPSIRIFSSCMMRRGRSGSRRRRRGDSDARCNLNNTLTCQLLSKDEGRKFFTGVLDRFVNSVSLKRTSKALQSEKYLTRFRESSKGKKF